MYHGFSEYKTDFTKIPGARPILISCRFVSFEYVANASDTSDPNCRCKHSLDTHETGPPYRSEGYLRLDPSGRSRLDDDFLNQPITDMDHPILREHVFLDPNSKYDFILFYFIHDFIVFIQGTAA
ncbi:unnamed protein product [Adineta steineri]|uniref:Uncharacterized protein n=1 Tax=Adineta steineri TaxID=433720 RepID=A0A814ZBL6_9BILA|nr:unnamed protein product [Adineta steineri]CAF4075546.1 unnamed protein product [Adineta steineri]